MLCKNLKVKLNHQFKTLRLIMMKLNHKYEELKETNGRESQSEKLLNSNEPEHYPRLPNQYHLPTKSWRYVQESNEHTHSPNDNAFCWGKRSSLRYEDNHSTWSRRNLDDETRIGSLVDPSIILLMDSNSKF